MTQLTLRFLKYIKGIFNPYAVWHSYFLYLCSHFRKKSEIVGEIFFPALKMQFGRCYWNIRKKMCKYKHSLTKFETSYIVALLNGTNCQFVDYKYWKSGHCTFIVVQLWAIFCQWPKRFMIFDIESKHWITLLK